MQYKKVQVLLLLLLLLLSSTVVRACVCARAEVLCDSADGRLEGRHLSAGDDVGFMTSSAGELRRTCSQYDAATTSSLQACQRAWDDDEAAEGEGELSGDEEVQASERFDDYDEDYDDEQRASVSSDYGEQASESPEWLDMMSAADQQDAESDDPQQQQQQQGEVTPPPADDIKASPSAARQAAAASRPVVAARSGHQRPAPPVSRVKPIVRQQQQRAGGGGGVSAADDTAAVSSISNKKHGTPQQPAAQQGSGSGGQRPVPAKRQPPPTSAKTQPPARQFDSLADVPGDVTSLSAADVGRCAQLLGIDQSQAAQLAARRVDGRQLSRLSAGELTQRFELAPLDANKLARFARGWRPT